MSADEDAQAERIREIRREVAINALYVLGLILALCLFYLVVLGAAL